MTTIIPVAEVKQYFLELQDKICRELANEDGSQQFNQDHWQREMGGEGCTCVLMDGKVIEKAGVNFSHIWGKQLPSAATAKRKNLNNCQFQALGISVIVHPRNPFAPTSHANLRLFVAENPDDVDQQPIWWFGGGFDLTPYYGFIEDCRHWHQMASQACAPFGENVYSRYKRWADEYFYLAHRQEPRGIGGLFFDDLNEWGFDQSFEFVKSIGNHFLPAYLPILSRRKNTSFNDEQRAFQLYRRGRYVEFNLIHDRGTLFGLQYGGRVESILISLPPLVGWQYNWQLQPHSVEANLVNDFLEPRDWI